MKAAVFAYSRLGCKTAERAAGYFSGYQLRMFAPQRVKPGHFSLLPPHDPDFYGQQFAWADVLLFVGSCGIAVRQIAPHVRDKRTDPAVLVMDETAAFVVPLLSGHIGGANRLAAGLAAFMGAVPVVTTATDIHGRFSVDAWAAQKGYSIGDMEAAKKVSAAILEGDVSFCSEFLIRGTLPGGVVLRNSGPVGIYVGVHTAEPFETTLRIIPPVLHLGVGCRRGISAQAIQETVEQLLAENGLDKRAIGMVGSIQRKADEAGLLEYCKKNRFPVNFYTEQELLAVPGSFTSSEFVRSVTGVDNVCERAAMVGASRILVRKTAKNGVTAALAAEEMEVTFG